MINKAISKYKKYVSFSAAVSCTVRSSHILHRPEGSQCRAMLASASRRCCAGGMLGGGRILGRITDSSVRRTAAVERRFFSALRDHQRAQNRRTAVVVFAGVVGMMSVPLVIRSLQSQPMVDSEKALTGSQVQRGPFMNSGSKDAGRDPDWNLRTRTWEGKRNDY